MTAATTTTTTHRAEPTTGESYTALSERYANAVNAAELTLVDFLTQIPEDARHSTALAVRRRTVAEAHRYVRSADLALRMPSLFAFAREDGRFSVDHLDAIWSRINRHTRALKKADALIPEGLDAAVATAVVTWVTHSRSAALTAVADVTDEVLCTVAPPVVEETEDNEAAAVSLTRRGTKFTLECGSETVANSLWSAMNDAALEVRREAVAEQEQESVVPPRMAQCRGEVALGLFGGRRDQLKVTVNAYRCCHDGPGYVVGTGWISPTAADTLAELTRHIRELPDAADIPETLSYRFPTDQKARMEGRDGYCRFPECRVPADRCEHDHLVNSPHTDPDSDGPTSVENGACLCRTHHALKTAGIWNPVSRDGAATIDWHGPGGVVITTVAAGPLAPPVSS